MKFAISLLAVILVAFFYLYKKTFSYWSKLGVVQFPVTFPHGNIKGMSKKFHLSQLLVTYYQKIKAAGEAVGGLYFFN